MENITETVMNEATPVIETSVDAAAKAISQSKSMGTGKKTVVALLITTVIGIGGYVYYKSRAKAKAKEEAEAQDYDNVDVAKSDFLDDPEEPNE